jgi:hypothetical protein
MRAYFAAQRTRFGDFPEKQDENTMKTCRLAPSLHRRTSGLIAGELGCWVEPAC